MKISSVDVGNANGQPNAAEVKPVKTVVTSDDMEMPDLDDLIPSELRTAVDKTDKTKAPVKTKATSKKEAADDKQEDSSDDEPDEQTDDDGENGDLDLSPDNIDKMLDGDPNAVDKKEKEEEKPSWHEDETYKELLSKTKFSSITPEKLDKLIVDAIDKKVLKDAEERKTLDTELEALRTQEQLNTAEISRLKNIERVAYFDSLPETAEKYKVPMGQIATSVKSLLELEGTKVTTQQILSTKNRAEFTELTKDIDFDDQTLLQLTNYWRSYKDLEFKYGEDRKSAQTDLKKHLSHSISDKSAKGILQTSLLQFINADEKYSYIKKAVQEGFDKHEGVANLLQMAQSNFMNIIRAISNPVDYSKDAKWLSDVANYTLEAAHSAYQEDQNVELRKEKEVLTKNLIKVVKAYKKLYGSAEGISGKKGVSKTTESSNGREEKEDLEEFKSLLNNKISIDDVLSR